MNAKLQSGTPVKGLAREGIWDNNPIYGQVLGICSTLAVTNLVLNTLVMCAALVLTGTTALNWLVYELILVPLELEFLRFILFIVMIAAFVQFVEMILERYLPVLYQNLGIFLPLITVNCAILGGSLFMVIREYSLLTGLIFGLGSGAGWMLAIVAMAGIREKLDHKRISPGLHGPGITLIIVGHMALAFIGFTGVLSGG